MYASSREFSDRGTELARRMYIACEPLATITETSRLTRELLASSRQYRTSPVETSMVLLECAVGIDCRCCSGRRCEDEIRVKMGKNLRYQPQTKRV